MPGIEYVSNPEKCNPAIESKRAGRGYTNILSIIFKNNNNKEKKHRAL